MSGYNTDGLWEEDSSIGEQQPAQEPVQQTDTNRGGETSHSTSFGGNDQWNGLFGSNGIFGGGPIGSERGAVYNSVGVGSGPSDGMPKTQDFIESLRGAAGIGKDLIGSLFGEAKSGKLTIRDLASGLASAYSDKSRQDAAEKVAQSRINELNTVNQQKIDADNRHSESIKGMRSVPGIVQAAQLKRRGGTAVFQTNGKVS